VGTGTQPLLNVNAARKRTIQADSHDINILESENKKLKKSKSDSSMDTLVPQSGYEKLTWVDSGCPAFSLIYDTIMEYAIDSMMNEPIHEFAPQSGMVSESGIMKQVKAARYQNVAFTEQHEPYLYDTEAPVDPTRNLQCTDDATLDNFFSRPIKVADYEWSVTTNLWQQLNPWSLFFENPRVINRIVNYNLLRAKLKMKLVINGSGFHYGRALASYKPMHTLDDLS